VLTNTGRNPARTSLSKLSLQRGSFGRLICAGCSLACNRQDSTPVGVSYLQDSTTQQQERLIANCRGLNAALRHGGIGRADNDRVAQASSTHTISAKTAMLQNACSDAFELTRSTNAVTSGYGWQALIEVVPCILIMPEQGPTQVAIPWLGGMHVALHPNCVVLLESWMNVQDGRPLLLFEWCHPCIKQVQ
jgi:hypothetical protein